MCTVVYLLPGPRKSFERDEHEGVLWVSRVQGDGAHPQVVGKRRGGAEAARALGPMPKLLQEASGGVQASQQERARLLLAAQLPSTVRFCFRSFRSFRFRFHCGCLSGWLAG